MTFCVHAHLQYSNQYTFWAVTQSLVQWKLNHKLNHMNHMTLKEQPKIIMTEAIKQTTAYLL